MSSDEQCPQGAISTLDDGERPRERLAKHGSSALSTAELLAILLGSGIAGSNVLRLSQELLLQWGSIDAIANATVAELCQQRGIGPAKALQLQAALALGRRLRPSDHSRSCDMRSPKQAFAYLQKVFENYQQECFVVVLQDVKSRVLRHDLIAMGTMEETLVHPREVFYPAIRHKASAVLLAHNHPSGDTTPSGADIALTQRLYQAGQILGIEVVDHLIVGRDKYLSMRQKRCSPFDALS